MSLKPNLFERIASLWGKIEFSSSVDITSFADGTCFTTPIALIRTFRRDFADDTFERCGVGRFYILDNAIFCEYSESLDRRECAADGRVNVKMRRQTLNEFVSEHSGRAEDEDLYVLLL